LAANGLRFIVTAPANAHDDGEARYIANEAVLVTSGETKILFDPLPLTGFGTYPDVPEADRQAMMTGAAPYDGIDAVFISHAHRDHFSASAMIAYLLAQTEVKLAASQQALEMMQAQDDWDADLLSRIISIDLAFGAEPVSLTIGDITASAVRIPHSGWPQRADVQNLFFRVSLNDDITVMHMGDADINPRHYIPYEAHWQARETDMAFPPYWIYLYPYGPKILDFMNVKQSVGIHVPIKVPADLKASGADYFSIGGETRAIGNSSKDSCAPVTFDDADFTVCTISADSNIRTFWQNPDGEPYSHFGLLNKALAAKNQNIVIAMNGGMYDKKRAPVGYYVEAGEKRKSLQTKESYGNFGLLPNGVFYVTQDGVGVSETLAFAATEMDVISATQSGPMLVIDGKLHPKFRRASESEKRRNGVGVSADGQTVYFVISDAPVNFHHFARLFRDHLKTPNALYLDGVVSRLYDPANERDDPGLPMGPILAVVR